jgi:hypothetical protein
MHAELRRVLSVWGAYEYLLIGDDPDARGHYRERVSAARS